MKDQNAGFGAADVVPLPTQPFTRLEAPSAYQFYRCFHCGRLLTRDDELRAFNPASTRPGMICPCGSSRYFPGMPRGIEWFTLRNLRFLWTLWTAAGHMDRLGFVAWVIRESRMKDP